jgi:glutamate 5-kinase
MVNADYLFLLTDVDCLYTDNPRKNPDAKPVEVVEDVGTLKGLKDSVLIIYIDLYIQILTLFNIL